MTAQTYKITRMEKLLGRWYKWWFTVKYFFKLRTVYAVDNIFFAFGQLFTLSGVIIVWYVASQLDFGSTEFRVRLTYFIIGTIYYNLIMTWPSFYGYSIKKGEHSTDLLRPSSIFGYLWAKFYGVGVFQGLTVLFVLTLISPLWIKLIFKPESLWFLLLYPLSLLILFFIELLIAFLDFFVTEINGITMNVGFFQHLLSGRMFPLGLLITLFFWNWVNPFAYLFYHPMQIYLGEYSNLEILYVFLGGIAWCIALYFLAKFIFLLGLKNNESVGL